MRIMHREVGARTETSPVAGNRLPQGAFCLRRGRQPYDSRPQIPQCAHARKEVGAADGHTGAKGCKPSHLGALHPPEQRSTRLRPGGGAGSGRSPSAGRPLQQAAGARSRQTSGSTQSPRAPRRAESAAAERPSPQSPDSRRRADHGIHSVDLSPLPKKRRRSLGRRPDGGLDSSLTSKKVTPRPPSPVPRVQPQMPQITNPMQTARPRPTYT